jgi:hypothetical protein
MSNKVEDQWRLSISKLRKWGYLSGLSLTGELHWRRTFAGRTLENFTLGVEASSSRDHIQIDVPRKPGREPFNYRIKLMATPCNFGGQRFWFICPLKKGNGMCGRRAAVLYGGPIFGCRQCFGLSYESQSENSTHRNYPYRPILDAKRVDELYARMKRKYYGGKPTRLYARILAIEGKYGGDYNFTRILERAECSLLGS